MNKLARETGKRMWFKNPPIVEAVIALNVEMLPERTIDVIESLVESMAELGYGQVEPVWQHQIELKFEAGVSSQGNSQPFRLGTKFRSADGLNAVQFNRTGIVFSRLGKYDSWETFRGEAQKLWKIFSTAVESISVKNIGVRYINKLFIPADQPAEGYVTVWPHLPEGIVQKIEGLTMQLAMPIEAPVGRLLHTQLLLPVEKDGFSTLLFDNDFQFETANMVVSEIWQMLEEVRDVKDYYFEKFTTPKMRESFDA